MSNPITITENRAAFEAGRTSAALSREPIRISPSREPVANLILVPEGYRVEDAPVVALPRRFGFEVRDLESFEQAVKDYARKDQSVILLDPATAVVRAIFDFHPARVNDTAEPTDAAGEAMEQARWSLTTPAESAAWFGIDGKAMSQVAFAEFLEDYAGAIVSPDQADVIQVARELQAKKNVTWKSAQRLQDGAVDLQFSEELEAKTSKGTVEIPETLGLRLCMFDGVDPREFKARLRYRFDDGKLTFTVRILHLAQIREAVLMEVAGVVETATGLPVYLGTVNA